MRPGTKTTASFLAIFLAAWVLVRYLMPLCFPFLLGTGLALLAEPVVKLFTGKLRLPRGVAAGIGVTAAFAGVAFLLLILCAFLLRELGVLAGILPDLTEAAQSGLNLLQGWALGLVDRTPGSVRELLRQNVAGIFSGGTALVDKAFRYILGLAGTLLSRLPDSALSVGTSLIAGYMISARFPAIRRWIRTRLPREKLRPLLHTLDRIRRAVAGWVTAQLKLAGMTLLILGTGLLLLRIRHGLLWAAVIALVDAFPILGTGTILLPWAAVCFLQGDMPRAVGLLGVYALISLTRSVLEPRLVGKELGLDPLVTLFALYAGYRLWGIGGMILSPLLAVMAVQVVSDRQGKTA